MKRLASVGCLFLLVFLSGCIEYTEEIWVNDDGSGTLELDLGMSEMLMQMGDDEGAGGPFGDLREKFGQMEEDASRDPNLKSISFNEYTENAMAHVVIRMELLDITKIGDLPEQMVLEEESQEEDKPAPEMEVTITRNSSGNYAFSQILQIIPPPKDEDDEPATEGEDFGRSMIVAMFADKYFTVILHGPEILFTNGEISSDQTTSTWQIPFADLVEGKEFYRELNAEVMVKTETLVPSIITETIKPASVRPAQLVTHYAAASYRDPLPWQATQLSGPRQVIVTATEAAVRRAPGPDEVVVRYVHSGKVLLATAISGNWYRVLLSDGRYGWLSRTQARVRTGFFFNTDLTRNPTTAQPYYTQTMRPYGYSAGAWR